MTAWSEVFPEHQSNVGFVEGANNQNPWGPEQGVFNASYCDSAACMVPYHHGVRWPSESQFGEKGCAYCPYDVNVALSHGWFWYDHTSRNDPCDLLPGDKVYFDWNGTGTADHVETVVAVYDDGTFDTIGYNTGHPEGCHLVRRDRRYLLGRFRMQGTLYGDTPPAVIPMPTTLTPPPEEDEMPLFIIRNKKTGEERVVTPMGTWHILDAVKELPDLQYAIVKTANIVQVDDGDDWKAWMLMPNFDSLIHA